ncbi:hypothetical protein HYDPIDRAFT_170453 [Hydnomerulius pinastri MD-312]|uniref:Uncharacterized protein n=1 Tax=Hydnomerulius pinastri MD-312 TaxID=994086 RepID=A0A0C9VQN7_9AGAM|nr:hypothetical protein HYDPIDRAFT_170453 [Hydnomerulius pinastri MD-312]
MSDSDSELLEERLCKFTGMAPASSPLNTMPMLLSVHLRMEKSWRPIVTVAVGDHQCCELILACDGQNPNLKQSFKLRVMPDPRLQAQQQCTNKATPSHPRIRAAAGYWSESDCIQSDNELDPLLKYEDRGPVSVSLDHLDSEEESALPAKRSNTILWFAASILPTYTEAIAVDQGVSTVDSLIDSFSPYRELRKARVDSDYERVLSKLQAEWTFIGASLVALARLEAAVFGFSSGSLFPVDLLAQRSIAIGSIASAIGLSVDAWFLLVYNGVDSAKFQNTRRGYSPHRISLMGGGGEGGKMLGAGQLVIAGVGAGLANDFVSGPVEHIRIRLQTQSNTNPLYKGPFDAIKKIASEHGIAGPFKGQCITFLREATPSPARDKAKEHPPSPVNAVIYGATAGYA